MKQLLLTGFEPFLEFPMNPTEDIVRNLHGDIINEYEIIGKLLPVDFHKASHQLLALIDSIQPDGVVMLGLAAGRSCMTPERVAINCKDGAEDNRGTKYEDAKIIEDGPDAYFTKLPIRSMVNKLQENGLPAQISNTAGTYLCNYVMYAGLHHLSQNNINIPAGFIHVPASHQLVATMKRSIPSWSIEDLTKGIQLSIECLTLAKV